MINKISSVFFYLYSDGSVSVSNFCLTKNIRYKTLKKDYKIILKKKNFYDKELIKKLNKKMFNIKHR